MSSTLSRRTLTGAAALSLLASGLLVGTAGAAEKPDMRSTLLVPSGNYMPGDLVPVKLVVTNAGKGVAQNVRGENHSTSGTSVSIENPANWGDLLPYGAGTSFQPGETRRYLLQARLGADRGDALARLGVVSPNDANPRDDIAAGTITVRTPEKKVTITGQVFGDADQDGKASPGEGLAGAKVQLSPQPSGADRTATTGADGKYTFTDVPAGNYAVRMESLPGGWINHGSKYLRLDGSKPVTEAPIRALRPLAESLRVTGALDKTSYTDGEQGKVTVTLTNTGTVALRGVFIACDRVGNEVDLDIPAKNWGELDEYGPGATVEPGQTREFTARGPVRPRSGSRGYVSQNCDFAQSQDAIEGEPSFVTSAKVTGRTGSTSGRLYRDVNGNNQPDPGEGLAGLELRLTDEHNGHQFTGRTDAEGKAVLTGPAGRYRVAVPGWTHAEHPVVHLIAPDGGATFVWQMSPAS